MGEKSGPSSFAESLLSSASAPFAEGARPMRQGAPRDALKGSFLLESGEQIRGPAVAELDQQLAPLDVSVLKEVPELGAPVRDA